MQNFMNMACAQIIRLTPNIARISCKSFHCRYNFWSFRIKFIGLISFVATFPMPHQFFWYKWLWVFACWHRNSIRFVSIELVLLFGPVIASRPFSIICWSHSRLQITSHSIECRNAYGHFIVIILLVSHTFNEHAVTCKHLKSVYFVYEWRGTDVVKKKYIGKSFFFWEHFWNESTGHFSQK